MTDNHIVRHRIFTSRGPVEIAWDMQTNGPVDPRPSRTKIIRTEFLDWSQLVLNRAGIIPYRKLADGKIRFCLGRDRKSGDLTDFGGGLSYKKDNSVISGALRELREESLGVFTSTVGQINFTSLAVYNDYSCIFFAPLYNITAEDEKTLCESFQEKSTEKSEMKELVWVDLDDLLDLLNNQHSQYKLYSRVQMLLKNNLAFVNRL